jgi:hypothetical protein
MVSNGQVLLWASSVVLGMLVLYVAHAASRSLVVGIPADFFSRGSPHRSLLSHAVRAAFGAALIIAGILMLVLPGPGLLAILAGVLLIDGGSKRALVRRLLASDHVRASVDNARRRAGQPPLVRP